MKIDNKKNLLCVLVALFAIMPCAAQKQLQLQGKIVDGKDKKPLAGVVIYSKENPYSGVTSDEEGRFSLPLSQGRHTIICSLLGYKLLETVVNLRKNENLQLSLNENLKDLDEVVVTLNSAMSRVADVQIGVEKIEIEELAKVPALFGERDIIKSIQLLPGIKSEGDGSSGYQVRGGTSAQNLILLDGATVYNAGHLMGIFSTFNDDALSNASLYKGQIPAQFGGATSSVFDINTKAGDMQQYKLNASLGLLSAKLSLEGPVVKDKVSCFVSARRSYLDLFLKLSKQYRDNTMNFYDINAKVNYNIGQKDFLSVSFFTGKDNMGLEDLMKMKWGNMTATVRWYHNFNEHLYSNTTAIFSNYDSDIGMKILNTDYDFGGFIRQYGLKESFIWSPNKEHNLQMGFQSTYLQLKSAEWKVYNLHQKEKRDAWENSLWVNENWKVTDKLELSAGLRFNTFSALGGAPYYELDSEGDIAEIQNYSSGDFVKTYYMPEPRFSLNYSFTDRQSIKVGYSRTSQNIQAIRNGSSSMPFDRYTMSSNLLKPQTANQTGLGYMAVTNDGKYEFSVEGYYKAVENVYDYKDGKSFNSEIEIERLILGGKGRAYGAEFFTRKNMGRLTGWLSYTLSWAENKIDGINNNKWYTAGNDRRHDFSIVAMYALTNSWDCSATWVYNTGQALTAPSAKYEVGGETYYYYAERNGYRAPAYHRLDVSFTHTKKKKNYTRQWAFGLYNAYNRYNPYIITFENDDTKLSGTKTVQHSLFGIIPSVSYNIKF